MMHFYKIWPTGFSGISVALVVYYINHSYNVPCCITIINPFRHAYLKNPVDVLILTSSLSLGSVTYSVIAVTWALVICLKRMPAVVELCLWTLGIHFLIFLKFI